MKRTTTIFCLLSIVFCCFAAGKTKKQDVNIVFIGNSITESRSKETAPPVKTTHYLRTQLTDRAINFSNQGVSGSTTVDFLPASNTRFPNVRQAADAFAADKTALLLFSVMLGTNDSAIKGTNGAPVSPTQYRTNLKVIIDELLALYPNAKIVLHHPLWYSPSTYNGAMYLLEGLNRLQSYFPEIAGLVAEYAQTKPGSVWMGDTEGFDFFKENHLTFFIKEEGNAGVFYLHPNDEGNDKLAEFWGKALLNVIAAQK
jgi:lysophospholipase L1-like esterase